jgi:hypothetical protein
MLNARTNDGLRESVRVSVGEECRLFELEGAPLDMHGRDTHGSVLTGRGGGRPRLETSFRALESPAIRDVVEMLASNFPCWWV